MSVKVQDNSKTIVANADAKYAIALRNMLKEIGNISEPKTPRRFGNLRENILKQVLGLRGTIVWRQNYAVYQEEKKFKNYSTPGTGPHYARDAVKTVVEDSQRFFKEAGVGE